MRSLIDALNTLRAACAGDEPAPRVAEPEVSRGQAAETVREDEIPGALPQPDQSPGVSRRLWIGSRALTAPPAPAPAAEAAPAAAPAQLQGAAETPRAQPQPRAGGPGVSKLRYRVARAWAKPRVRSGVTVYLPLALLGLVGWRLAADDEIRLGVERQVTDFADQLAARPEFALNTVTVTGASERLRNRIEEVLAFEPGTSSLRTSPEEVRAAVESLGAVRSADVRFDPAGTLEIGVVERMPAALWRDGEGTLKFVDRDGVVFGRPGARVDQPGLPLILGNGATGHVAEALALFASVPGLQPRIRALVRVGERRWDVALDHDTTIMLPGEDPAIALDAAMKLHADKGVLDADLAVIDMRLSHRPTLRFAPGAQEAYQLRRKARLSPGENT